MKPDDDSSAIALDHVLITAELARRPQRPHDHAAENRALTLLAQELASHPHRMLQTLSDLVLALCGAESAGISILEAGAGAHVLRWHATSGAFASCVNEVMPLEASPCGVVIERNSVLLFENAERIFPAMRTLEPKSRECLLAPWAVNGVVTGTVWAVMHDPNRHFDAEDARILQSLAAFAASGYKTIQSLAEAEAGRSELERRVQERTELLARSNLELEREIAQRRQAEAALRASQEERYRRLFSMMDQGFCVLERLPAAPGRPVDFRYLEANQAMTRHTGLRDVIGKTILELVPNADPAVMAIYDQVASTGESQRFETYLKTLDLWMDAQVYPAEGPGQVAVLFSNISERKHVEQALKEADQRKDEFLATLAHELRNPLAPISNAVQILQRPDGRRKADRMIEMIGRQVQQIIKLVDDLLEISRITRGKIALQRETIRLEDVVATAIETSRPQIDAGHHQLCVSLPQETIVLHADAVRLTQVLSNLLNNAAKYTDAHGRIDLCARIEDGQACIAVRDNGIGIPAAQLPHLFEMFTQAHRDHASSQSGLGIGLAMVRKLVELHGGTVTAHSDGPGRGSEFIVRLPLSASLHDQGATAPALATGSVLRGERILVVDDNRDAADSLAMLLEAAGAEVAAVYDGESALAALAENEPRLLLLDLGMPGMDGYAVARAVRADARLRELRIVALTGWGQESERLRTREWGFDHHLTKPLDLQALEVWLAGTPTV